MTAALHEWIHQVLGDHAVVGDLPVTPRRAGTSQRVVEVVDSGGQRWYAKRVHTPRHWRAEVHAYRNWVPALHSFAPTMRAAEESIRALLVSAVPGRSPHPEDARANRQAGALLRRMHEAVPARMQEPSDRDRSAMRLEKLLTWNPGLLTPEEEAFARSSADRIRALPLVEKVPCHGDYKAHNWLVDEQGTLRVIDFGEARWGEVAFDLSKLFFGAWWRRPDLAAAFLQGYGRRLEDHELAFIQLHLATAAVSEIAFGHNRGRRHHLAHGRSRLADLMSGHQLKAQLTVLEKTRRRVGQLRRTTAARLSAVSTRTPR